jgi:flagellar hook protein FlgE
MMRSLYSGVAGLKTHQTRMDVIGNNIANVNTTAFKSSAVSFEDIMYQTTSAATGATQTKGGKNAKQIGLGTMVGATKISITNGGSAQSTGDALDIKLTDANSTNFFIVNNGAQNVFTRAGSFYLDGNGDLAMTTTGYLVQGWQAVDNADGTRTIQRDTVSPLRIMSAENKTSKPEATTEGNVTGVVDKKDTNINSVNGRAFTLGFYDAEGYSYTARFTVKAINNDQGTYSVKLTNIYDSNQTDILKQWTDSSSETTPNKTTDSRGDNIDPTSLYSVFGDPDAWQQDQYTLGTKYTFSDGYLFYTVGSGSSATVYRTEHKVTDSGANSLIAENTDITSNTSIDFFKYTVAADGTGSVDTTTASNKVSKSLNDIYGVSSIQKADGSPLQFKATTSTGTDSKTGTTSAIPTAEQVTINPLNGKLQVSYHDTACILQFNPEDGTFRQIIDNDNANPTNQGDPDYGPNSSKTDSTVTGLATEGGTSAVLKLDALSNLFPSLSGQTINLDFSKTLNYDNAGQSTVGADRGSAADSTVGAGKALGALTGVSVSENGQIFGSYDNGNTVLLGQIAVAQFANASGLQSLGDNCYGTTLNSGDFDGIGVEVTADGGSMSTGQLEMSNVDLAQEFTDMITTQRGFQANSRIITVSDTMLEELTNLKR